MNWVLAKDAYRRNLKTVEKKNAIKDGVAVLSNFEKLLKMLRR